MSPTVAFVLLGVVAGVVGVLIQRTAAPRRSLPKPKPMTPHQLFLEALRDDPDVVADDTVFSLRSRDGRFTVEETWIGYKEKEYFWDVVGPTLRLRGRTTLKCAPQGLIGDVFNTLGLGDVKTGDEAFDARALLTGSDHDVVRAVMCHPEVRRVVERLLNGPPYLVGCEVDREGVLRVRFHRQGDAAEMARAAFHIARALADALDAAADVPPMRSPEVAAVTSVSASSGAPVGFGAR